MITMFCKSLLPISLLFCCALPFRTASDVEVTANPSCGPTSQRTILLNVETDAGTAADSLRMEDLSLLEDKTPREILRLESKTNEPLAVAILIDSSVSQQHSLQQTRLAAQRLVELIVQPTKDRAAVVSFTGEAKIEEQLTDDLARLQSAISRVRFVPPEGYIGNGVVVRGGNPPSSNPKQVLAGSTAIWDAVSTASQEILKAAADSRRAIVLLTDGDDTASDTKLSEAIADASRHEVAVFAIGIADKNYGGVERQGLNKLSEQTGGRAFFPKNEQELPAILIQIQRELRTAYLLTYCVAGTGSDPGNRLSTIKIQIQNPQSPTSNLRLLYRRYGW